MSTNQFEAALVQARFALLGFGKVVLLCNLDLIVPEGSIVKMKFTNHNKWVPTVRWSSTNENYFVSGSYDHTIRIWDWRK